MDDERRAKAIETLLLGADWQEIESTDLQLGDGPDTLYATHKAVLEIGAAELRVYQLNDGQRVFDADDVAAFLSPAPEPVPGAKS